MVVFGLKPCAAHRTAALKTAGGLVAVVGLCVCLLMVRAAPAHADGDPASDVLLGQNVFYPYSPPSAALQHTLDAETAAVARSQPPIKVALVASPVDLGAVPALFGKPQQYADFLEQEITAVQNQQRLLVVMAGGYGVQGVSTPARAALASLANPAGGAGNDLARAAVVAVARLAAADGHPIPGYATAPKSVGASSLPMVAGVVGAAALVAIASVAAVRRGRHT